MPRRKRLSGRQIAKAKDSRASPATLASAPKETFTRSITSMDSKPATIRRRKAKPKAPPKSSAAKSEVTLITKPKSPMELTREKKKEHGDWKEQADMVHLLKVTMRHGRNWFTLENYQREALEMNQLKVSRILTGNPGLDDHWDDIAGYAFLGKGGHK